jgi:hypothetical protein
MNAHEPGAMRFTKPLPPLAYPDIAGIVVPALRETTNRIEEAHMKHNQNSELKKGSADRSATGSKQGMPGGQVGRGEMSMGSSSASNQSSRSAGSRSDYGGSEGNSRQHKSARNGSDSNLH